MLYCVILGMSYSSSLKSFLTTPDMVPSLNSLAEIVDTDLPLKMQLYGTAEEAFISRMTDPVHKKFWQKKIVLDSYNLPVEY